MDPALHSNTDLFIRQDKVKKSLQQPYTGPFKVLSRTTKHFTVDVNGRREVISVDRLKPANLLVEEDHPSLQIILSPEALEFLPAQSTTGRTTHSG